MNSINEYCCVCKTKLFYCPYPKIIMYLPSGKPACEDCYLKFHNLNCKQVVNVYFRNELIYSKDIKKFNLIFEFKDIDKYKLDILSQLYKILKIQNKQPIDNISIFINECSIDIVTTIKKVE